MKKVLLGMSGGIDSTASAVLLKEKGFKVTGLTFVINGITDNVAIKAKTLCDKLNMEHQTIDITKDFNKEVVSYFKNEYANGRTPNPCIRCNKTIKFGKIYDYAIENGFDYVATGHYAKIENIKGVSRLSSPEDQNKDQTYFLHVLKEHQFQHILFPLGNYTKDQARQICQEHHLLPAKSKESQEICFIKTNYHDYLQQFNVKNKSGHFIDELQNDLGKHKGLIHYTVGQRKGLGKSFGKRMFVKELNSKTGNILLTEEKNLYAKGLLAKNITLIHDSLPQDEMIYAKIRYAASKIKVSCQIENNDLKVWFSKKQRAVTPGQFIVLYTGEYVIGGAEIEKALNE